MDIEDLIRTDPIPDGAASVLVQLSGGGTIFGGVVAQFPSEIPILISFGGEGTVTSALDVTGDTGFVDNVQHIQLHKSTNPITGFNVALGDANEAIINYSGSFLELTDTPDAYTGQTLKNVRVKSDETGLEFVTSSSLTSPLTTKGDLWSYSTIDARLPVGSNGKIIVADSSQTDGLGYSTRDLDAGTHKINNVTDPTSAQDAATKNYVDTHVYGLAVTFLQVTGSDVVFSDTADHTVTGLSYTPLANHLYEIDVFLVGKSSEVNGARFGIDNTNGSGQLMSLCSFNLESDVDPSYRPLGIPSTLQAWGEAGTNQAAILRAFVFTTTTDAINVRCRKLTAGTLTIYIGSRMTVTQLV